MKKLSCYMFFVTALCLLLFSFSLSVSATDFPPPVVIDTESTESTVTISWDKVENMYGYKVYKREPGGKFTAVGSTKRTEYTVKNLSADTEYEFRIKSFTKHSNGSKEFGESCETFSEKTKLTKPSDLTFVTATTDSITFTWDKVEGAEYYKIAYGISGKSGYTEAGTTTENTFKIENLNGENRYKIKVVAKSDSNRSLYSDLIKLYTVPEKAGAPKAVAKDGGSVTLSWEQVGKANLYYVYVSTAADGKYKRAGSTKDTTFTYVKKTPKKAYYFKVVPLIETKYQFSRGQASTYKKASIGNISIDCPDIVHKGEYPEITVPYYNSKVKWKTSDKSVIKVSGGRLYAAGQGTVTLTATYKDFKTKLKVKVSAPTLSYRSAVYDVTNKEYIFKNRIDSRCYPASITKLITALVALKYMDEDDIIVVGNELNMVEAYSSRCDIQRGEKFRLKDILYGLLLPSGGDAAYTIAVNCARKVSGNPNMGYVAAKNYFVSLINKYMKAIGATGTNCVNPHGYPVSGHYSTVHDLVLVARKVLANDTLRQITSMPYKYVVSLTGQKHSWSTTNSLIKSYAYYYHPYAHGMKTGTVDDEYTGIISAATKDGRTIVTVVIGCESYNARYDATHKLLRTYL